MHIATIKMIALAFLAITLPALAQREPLSDAVRERALSREVLDPYWNGFIAKAQGNCKLAIQELKSIAKQGRGFEDAQTAHGVCEMIEAGFNPRSSNQALDLEISPAFLKGRELVLKAAESGFHEAQAEIIRLYVLGLGPDKDPIEGAKWAQLYLANPYRLTVGLANEIEEEIESLQNKMTANQWVLGKERARNWHPVFGEHSQQPLSGNIKNIAP